ncbi:MAG: aldehyde dehydrogenase (NAD+) [Alphaproteobacteria bacterium]|jgi:aldehyde dehydrogenase (NAD+)
MDLSTIEMIVDKMRLNFNKGLSRPLDKRKAQLKQLERMLTENEKRFFDALSVDIGKGEYESYTSEIGFMVGEIHYNLKKIDEWASLQKVSTPLIAQPASSYRVPQPLGVVLIIGAWNYPIQLALGPLIAAIAAGNAAIVKPSELSSSCSALLAELIPKYLDNDLFSVIEGAVGETTELLKQKFNHIFYTGGEAVGKIVMRAAAEHLTPVSLELGGKSPCIVDKNTSLDTTAARIAWSKWINVGQTCIAPDYVIVEREFADKLVDALVKKIQSYYGDNIKSNADYGRIVSKRHVARLASYLDNQNVIYGGEYDEDEKFFSPTIVMDPDPASGLMQQEIFGPILPICIVDDIKESIELVNSRPHPLAFYLYTKNSSFEKEVVNSTTAGNMCINDGIMFMANPNLPFGGVGNSGMGSYHGKAGFDTFSHYKSVMKRGTILDPSLRYPPYTSSKLSIMRKLM